MRQHTFSYITLKTKPATGDAFIGRRRQLAEIQELLCADHPYHVSVFGMPHIGKTSLLLALCNELNKQDRFVAIPVTPLTERRLSSNLRNVLDAFADINESAAQIISELDLMEDDLSVLLETFRRAIRATGKRVVLFLDECEHIDSIGNTTAWTQEEYDAFVSLLLDNSLDFCCVTASRPRMSNILHRFKPALNPFIPKLLYGFDDGEMEAFFHCVDANGFTYNGHPLRAPENDELFQAVLRYGGRSPYLLTMLACALLDSDGATPFKTLYTPWKQRFEAHFNDNIAFMVHEENKKLRSFSHIIKCFFGPYLDYQDVKERCITLGYLDLACKDSPYTYQGRMFEFDDADDRFTVYDQHGNTLSADEKAAHGLVYTTVCPLFTDYLFAVDNPIGKTATVPLSLVQDPRDLLTGLILTLRAITESRFVSAWGPDWYTRLLPRFSARAGNKTQFLVLSSQNTSYELWEHDDQLHCTRVTPPVTLGDATYFATKQQLDASVNSLPHRQTPIFLKAPSLKFVQLHCTPAQGGTILDQINLKDHAGILTTFWNTNLLKFSQFFPGLPNGRNTLTDSLSKLTEFRNRIQHLSKDAYHHPDTVRDATICRDLLHRIYTYLYRS